MTARRSAAARLLASIVGLALIALPVGAQVAPARRAVTVDYVGAEGAYLPVGADEGLAEGDTLRIYPDATTTVSFATLVLATVTRRRSVARSLDPALALSRGDVLFLDLPSVVGDPAGTAAGGRAREEDTPGLVAAAATPAPRPPGAAPDRGIGPRVSGRVGFDLDLRETQTTWRTGDLFGETNRRFVTPTTRLSFRAEGLPGGLELRTNLRASYRYDDLANGPPPVSVRVYEAVLVKHVTVVPAEFRVGRFGNPYESYSGYFDGALLRVGGRSAGLGLVAGFEPARADERVSTALPKFTAFADYTHRGASWRYDSDVSIHLLRPEGTADVGYLGWTQRISVGRLSLHQRMRVDGGIDGRDWIVSDLRLRAGLRIAGPLTVRGGYARVEPNAVLFPIVRDTVALALPGRDEASVGIDLDGRRASLSLTASRVERTQGTPGRSLSGRMSLGLGAARLLLSGRGWWHDESASVSASPSLAFEAWGVRWRTGYRFYETRSTQWTLTTQAADLQLSVATLARMRLTLRGEQQWGSNLGGTRIQVSLWRSF